MIAAINEWDEDRQKRELASSMEGLAARMVADIVVMEPPLPAGAAAAAVAARAARELARTPDAILDLYEAKFLPAAESELAVAAFEVASQSSDESVLQWHSRLRELHGRAYPGEAVDNRALINRFTLGLRDTQIREWTWDRRPQTYAAALLHANNKTASKAILSGAAAKAAKGGEINAISRPKGRGRDASGGGGKGPGNCFFCEKPGHFEKECRAKKQWLAEQEKKKKKGQKKRAINAMEEDDDGQETGGDSPPELTDDEGEESEN